MTNNDLLLKNILLDDVMNITDLQAKALTEVLMLRVHYKQASAHFVTQSAKIRTEFADDEDAKNQAMQALLKEDAQDVQERRLSAQAFEQIVIAVWNSQCVKNSLNYSAKDFLTAIAEQLVELK